MSNIIPTIANLTTFLLCGATLLILQYRQFQALTQPGDLEVELEKQRLIQEASNLETLRYVPAFGFDALIADWTLLNFFDYFGDTSLREATSYSLSPSYFEVILDRNPYFWEAYFFLSASTTLYAGLPDRTVAILSDRLPHLSPTLPPQAYRLWRYKATDELLFLGDAESAKKSYEKGVEWAIKNGSPEALASVEAYQDSIRFLESDPDSISAQISAWSSILGNAFDEKTQQLAIDRIQGLGGNITSNGQGGYSISVP
jgi:hypothetical protein